MEGMTYTYEEAIERQFLKEVLALLYEFYGIETETHGTEEEK